MLKTHGTKNYNVDDQLRLLSIIAERLPRGRMEWKQIAEEYNASSEAKGKPRSEASLRRKFLSLSQSTKACRRGDFSSVQELVSDIKRKLAAKGMAHAQLVTHLGRHRNDQRLPLEYCNSEGSEALGMGLPQVHPATPLMSEEHRVDHNEPVTNRATMNEAAGQPEIQQNFQLHAHPQQRLTQSILTVTSFSFSCGFSGETTSSGQRGRQSVDVKSWKENTGNGISETRSKGTRKY